MRVIWVKLTPASVGRGPVGPLVDRRLRRQFRSSGVAALESAFAAERDGSRVRPPYARHAVASPSVSPSPSARFNSTASRSISSPRHHVKWHERHSVALA